MNGRRNRDKGVREVKVVPDSERTRRVQKISESYYANIPKASLMERAKSVGLSVVDFLLNYEMVLYEQCPADGHPILDGELVITWRRIENEAT